MGHRLNQQRRASHTMATQQVGVGRGGKASTRRFLGQIVEKFVPEKGKWQRHRKCGVSVETPPRCLIFLKYERNACKAQLIPFPFALFPIQILYRHLFQLRF